MKHGRGREGGVYILIYDMILIYRERARAKERERERERGGDEGRRGEGVGIESRFWCFLMTCVFHETFVVLFSRDHRESIPFPARDMM